MASYEEAWRFANECRKFEIEHFWKRAAYYWAYITGSAVAYSFALKCSFAEKTSITLLGLLALPFFNKIVLCVLAFIVFFFCFAWLLVNKGSKYWQTSWEAQIAELEDMVVGSVYKKHLNTDANNFKKCPFSLAGYRYSVSKVTLLCSGVLTVLTGALTVFHCTLFCRNCCLKAVLGVVISILMILIIYIICKWSTSKDNDAKKIKAPHYEWIQMKSIL